MYQVAALKILAQSRSSAASLGSQTGSEKDRELASLAGVERGVRECKLCPMCEAVFPLGCGEEFEQHVMDHFSYDDDPETLQYIAPDTDPP